MTLLALAACLLLTVVAGPDPAQAQTAFDSTSDETRYQAITRQSGKSGSTRVLQGIGLVLTLCLGVMFVRAIRNEALAARQAELEGWLTPNQLTTRHDDDDDDQLVGPQRVVFPEEPVPALDTYDDSAEPPEPEPSGAPARVIYHVGSYRFSADREVLGPAARSHLEDLCESLCSPDNTRRVVRVASGLSCRYAKSQVAAELAQMLADRGEVRVLAMEGDLDAPALHRVMQVHVPRGHGLSEQLQRMAELQSVDNASTLQLSPQLHALVESRWSTPAALALPQFSQLLSRQRDVYDFIIVDGPVVDTWPDADHFGSLIEGVVFVTLARARLPDTLTLVGQHFSHDSLLRIIKTGESASS